MYLLRLTHFYAIVFAMALMDPVTLLDWRRLYDLLDLPQTHTGVIWE